MVGLRKFGPSKINRKQLMLLIAISAAIVIVAALIWGSGEGRKLPYFSKAKLLESTITSDDEAKLEVRVKNPGETRYENEMWIKVINKTDNVYISRGKNKDNTSIRCPIKRVLDTGEESGSYVFSVSGDLDLDVVSKTVKIKALVLVKGDVTDEQIFNLTIKRAE